jgi:signal transduction histidine kinase
LGVPVAILMGFVHEPISVTTVILLAGLLAAWSLIASVLNLRIREVRGQSYLSMLSLAVIAAFAWALISQFLSGRETAAYGGFAVVIIEGAIRFGVVGSLAMEVVFAAGLVIAMQYREWKYDLVFSLPGYGFWTLLLLFVALSVGLATEETTRARRRSAELVRQRALLEERHRIARDLHDTVLKTLHGLALEAHALKKQATPQAASEKAQYIEDVCLRSGQEIRNMIQELRHETEEEVIAAQMSRMVEAWSKATGIETKTNIAGHDRRLPLVMSYYLRNVLSEALENIRKHASASKVSVSLELLPGEVRLEIADDGRGIGAQSDDIYGLAAAGKYGLLGMKERVEQLNGQFSIDSTLGTRLVISVPLILEGDRR